MMGTMARRATFSTTLPMASHALDKFKEVLREYRLANFDHTWPKRYVKEFVKGVDHNHDKFLEKDDFLIFLKAIDATDKLTPEEVDEALHEIIASNPMPKNPDRLPIDTMEHVMLDAINREEM